MSHERGTDVSTPPFSRDVDSLFDTVTGMLQRLDAIQSLHGWFARRHVAARTIPTVQEDEIVLWEDTSATKWYLVTTMDGNTKKVELT